MEVDYIFHLILNIFALFINRKQLTKISKCIFLNKRSKSEKKSYHELDNRLFIFKMCLMLGTSVTWPKDLFSKNLNLRKQPGRNFWRTFLKNCFRHLKLYSNPPSWLARGRCHMGTFWKTKDWSSHFWEGQPFRFWYVECHRQRRLKSTKTGISS